MGKVSFKQENHIGIITIDSPPVNALEKHVLDELEGVVDHIPDDVDVVIIHGAGKRAFVAGADIRDFPSLRKHTGIKLVKRGQEIFRKISVLKQPVIAAIDGYALGGGLELALACDIRVASKQSKLGFPEVGPGIIPGYGGTQRLPRLIGPGKAKQLIFSGKQLSAEEALQLGIIEEVTEGSALEYAENIAATIVKQGPLAVRSAKAVMNAGLNTTLEEGVNLEALAFGELCETEDKNEGAQAFLEKRRPQFMRK